MGASSDPTPVKRSNNEGLSSAETVEGRASPKGNGGQTAAARTLRRDTASNGLAAVRRAARQSKTVRFTALLHHITTDLLKQSYLALTRDAAPGTDGDDDQAEARFGAGSPEERRSSEVLLRVAEQLPRWGKTK